MQAKKTTKPAAPRESRTQPTAKALSKHLSQYQNEKHQLSLIKEDVGATSQASDSVVQADHDDIYKIGTDYLAFYAPPGNGIAMPQNSKSKSSKVHVWKSSTGKLSHNSSGLSNKPPKHASNVSSVSLKRKPANSKPAKKEEKPSILGGKNAT